MEKKIMIPCESCVHKGICIYEENTREYIASLSTGPTPIQMKAEIVLLEVKCEFMLPNIILTKGVARYDQ